MLAWKRRRIAEGDDSRVGRRQGPIGRVNRVARRSSRASLDSCIGTNEYAPKEYAPKEFIVSSLAKKIKKLPPPLLKPLLSPYTQRLASSESFLFSVHRAGRYCSCVQFRMKTVFLTRTFVEETE
jgi:hypothetical protein